MAAAGKVVTVAAIPATRDLIVIDSSDTVLAAFLVLVKNQILSAPVLDKATGEYEGFFDVRDMATYVTKTVRACTSEGSAKPHGFDDVSHLMLQMQKHQPVTVSAVVDLCGKDSFVPIKEDASILDAVKLLGEEGVHRLPVVNEAGEIVKILSQTTLCRFLLEHAVLVKILGRATIQESQLGIKDVVTVKQDTPVVEAFELMIKKGISGIGVVDGSGKLLTSLSNTDLRTIVSGQRFKFMGVGTLDFIALSRALDGPVEKPAVVTARAEDTLHDVMERMARAGLHRLYVVDRIGVPIGVITLKDILKYAFHATTD